jgi:hypothetical protein
VNTATNTIIVTIIIICNFKEVRDGAYSIISIASVEYLVIL